MASDDSAIVLLHGILMSGNAWQDLVPLLSDHHQVYAHTSAGHHGGPQLLRRPATVSDLVDAAERFLDERGLERPHLAGLSLSGWMAIELARRGRAASVCALAPAGFWSAGDSAQSHVKKQVHKFVTMGRLTRPARPVVALAMKSPTVRRLGLAKPRATRTELVGHRALGTSTTSSAPPLMWTTSLGRVSSWRRWIPCHAR